MPQTRSASKTAGLLCLCPRRPVGGAAGEGQGEAAEGTGGPAPHPLLVGRAEDTAPVADQAMRGGRRQLGIIAVCLREAAGPGYACRACK